MTDNHTDILNGTHAGLIFRSVSEAARAMLLDHLTVMGEHGPASALEAWRRFGSATITTLTSSRPSRTPGMMPSST
jgi:hypothetical protein